MAVQKKDNRVPNDALRDAVIKARGEGVSFSHICRVLAEKCDPSWVRWKDTRWVADTTRLQRVLGLKDASRGYMIYTIKVEVAQAICKAIDVDYSCLQRSAKICSCGEEHYGNQVICQFCIEELGAAA